jgi:N-acetylneuraminate synthase
MFDRLAESKLPFILSTGMSPIDEIDRAVEQVKSYQLPLVVMQCTSSYPCPPEKIGLNLITEFRERYDCAVGLSDHSGTIFPGLAAATLGVEALEVHVALSREMFGPDVTVSVTSDELRQLVEGIRFIERVCANPVDKNAMAEEMSPLRDLFTKSIVARIDIPAGTLLREEHLQTKKPGTGIAASRLAEFVGARLRRNVRANQLLREEDFETVNS